MKQLLVVAVALASVNAFATRARVSALGNNTANTNAPHIVDVNTVYSNPADMMVMGDFATFESGTTTGGLEGSNSEGMITRSYGESKFGLGLGHQSTNASAWTGTTLGLRSSTVSGVTGIVSQQNPVTLVYGTKMADWNVGGLLVYSNYNDKQNNIKESSGGFRLGGRSGSLDVKLGVGLLNTFENSTDKYKGTTGISAGAGYWMDDMYYNISAETAGFKTENATSGAEKRKFDYTKIQLGALKSLKKDGNEVFYGVSVISDNRKLTSAAATGDTKITVLSLPVTMGMEVDAASWLTLRGSVTQNVIISDTKWEPSNPATAPFVAKEDAPGLNTTVASVGAGLKFNKLTLDGTLKGLTGGTATQELSGNTLFGQVGMTYMF